MADTPKLTDVEADQLRFWLHPWGDGGLSLAERGLLSRHYKAPFPDGITALGRAALAAYDAEQRRRIVVEAMRAVLAVVERCGSNFEAGMYEFSAEHPFRATAGEIRALIAKEESDG